MMPKTYAEMLNELGVKNFNELSPEQQKIIESAYPNEVKFGCDIADQMRKQQETDNINKRNEELKQQEQNQIKYKQQQEVDNAIEIANRIDGEMREELQNLSIKYREKLFKSKQLNYDVNSKIVRLIIKQYFDRSVPYDEIKNTIQKAYDSYEFNSKHGLV